MREALSAIADATDSERLRKFLETGRDRKSMQLISLWPNHDSSGTAGDVTSETRLDMPRGLNQLGNTCYLNSLLQVRLRVFGDSIR